MGRRVKVVMRTMVCQLCGSRDLDHHGAEPPWKFCAMCAPMFEFEARLERILKKLTRAQKRALRTALVLVRPHSDGGFSAAEENHNFIRAVDALYADAEKWTRSRRSVAKQHRPGVSK